jgi:hypothetical protein
MILGSQARPVAPSAHDCPSSRGRIYSFGKLIILYSEREPAEQQQLRPAFFLGKSMYMVDTPYVSPTVLMNTIFQSFAGHSHFMGDTDSWGSN